MQSMTGYGKGVATESGYELTIELKTVNNRFLEVNNRIPKAFLAYDTNVRSTLGKKLSRGSVEVFYNYRNVASSIRAVTVDKELAKQYFDAARELSASGDTVSVQFRDLVELGAVMFGDEEMSEDVKKNLLDGALLSACDALNAVRAAEGKSLANDLGVLVSGIKERLVLIKERAPEIISAYQSRLRARVQEFLDNDNLDETRLLGEIAVYSDRVDTNEEIQRLDAHLAAFQKLLTADVPVGRNLDFLTQEMTREANTLGSKCSDLATTNLVLEIKNEIEKMKEQSRNAE